MAKLDVLATLPVPVVMVEIAAVNELGRAWANPSACGLLAGAVGPRARKCDSRPGGGWTEVDIVPLEHAGLPVSTCCAISLLEHSCTIEVALRCTGTNRRVRFAFSVHRVSTRRKSSPERAFVVGVGTDLGPVADRADVDDERLPELARTMAEIERIALIGHYVERPETGEVEWSPGLERVRSFPSGRTAATFAELSETVCPEDAVAVAAFESDQRWRRGSIEFRVVRPDGALRNIYRCAYRETAPDGQIVRVLGIEQDITEFRLAEKELAAAKIAAEAAAKSKSEFLGLMSHELRTPLNAIMGFSEVMSQELFGALSERYLDYSRQVHKSANQLLAIIDDILDLSRIEDGQYELGKGYVDLGKIVREVTEMMRPGAESRGVRLCVAAAGPEHFWAERHAIRTIVHNLVDNAIKFTRSGGEVFVEIAPGEERRAIIRVRDTGIGIRQRDIRRVCEPFFQSRAGMEEAGEAGTGLGLAIVRSLVDLHEGTIEIESEIGTGSTFSISIPGRGYVPGSAPLIGVQGA